MSKTMFVLDETQQQHLVLILNEINRQIYEACVARNPPPLKHHHRATHPIYRKPDLITGFNNVNRQPLTEFLVNSNRFFRMYFRLCPNIGLEETLVARGFPKWLENFYSSVIYENINFDQIFTTMTYHEESFRSNASNKEPILLSNSSKKPINGEVNHHHHQQQQHQHQQQYQPNLAHSQQHLERTMSMGMASPTGTSGHLYHPHHSHHHLQQQQQQQQLSEEALMHQSMTKAAEEVLYSGLSSNNNDNSNIINLEGDLQLIRDITFLNLLVTVLFYKLRHLIPPIAKRYDDLWKYIIVYEHQLESSFLWDNFMHILQTERIRQLEAKKAAATTARQEQAILERIAGRLDQEAEKDLILLTQQAPPAKPVKSTNPNVIATSNTVLHPTTTTTITSSSPLTSRDKSGAIDASTSGGSGGVGGGNGEVTRPKNIIRQCPECGKLFRNSYKLNRHRYTHKTYMDKPFECDWATCSYRSISRNDLNRHRMIHTGEKPFACDVPGCDKKYSRGDKLRHHKLTVHYRDGHVPKPDFTCSWPGCDYTPESKLDLARHQMEHSVLEEEAVKEKERCLEQQQQQQQQQQHHQQQPHHHHRLKKEMAAAAVAASQNQFLPTLSLGGSNFQEIPVASLPAMMLNPGHQLMMHQLESAKLVSPQDLPAHLALAVASSDSEAATTPAHQISVVSSNVVHHRSNTISVWSN